MNPFEEALRSLNEGGWVQHSAYGRGGSRCTRSALSEVVLYRNLGPHKERTVLRFFVTTLRTLGYALPLGCPPALAIIEWWNDLPERTFEDVKLALKHAAHDWEEAHRGS